MSLRIAVVCGGPSPEAEVSRLSASQVAAALRSRGHRCTTLEVDAELWPALQAGGFDCVFIAVHGRFGEDGTVQGVCELLGLPYTGSGLLATALCFDKVAAKRLFVAEGIATPPWRTVPAVSADPGEIERRWPRRRRAWLPAGGQAPPWRIDDRAVDRPRGGRIFCPRGRPPRPSARCSARDSWPGPRSRWGSWGIIPPGPCRPSRSSPNVPSTTMQRSTPRVRATMSFPPASPRRGVAPARTRRSGPTSPSAAATSRGSTSSSTRGGVPWVLEVNAIPGLTELSLLPDAARAAGISFPERLPGPGRRRPRPLRGPPA